MHYSRVFLIDDDTDDQELFRLALEQVNPSIECTVHPDGISALRALQSAESLPDLIFLDLNMPVMTGQQFLRELKKQDTGKDIPIVILSTSENQSVIRETRSLGADRFITKPNSFKELKNLMRLIFIK
jgi:CheY-like chemotaxis protein